MLSIVCVAFILGTSDAPSPWHILAWTTVALVASSPWYSDPSHFFAAPGRAPDHPLALPMCSPIFAGAARKLDESKALVSHCWLVISTFISASFGCSVHAASAWGLKYGVAGGLGYAVWYLGVCLMAVAVFAVRRRFPRARSLMGCIQTCFGGAAATVYGALCAYRLINAVWLSAFTAGTLFAERDDPSSRFWGALLSGAGPCVYCLAGGVRSILVTETLQGVTAFALLILIVARLPGTGGCWVCDSSDGGRWGEAGGFILLRFLQGCLSVPWVSAVLLDRLFMGTPRAALAGFSLGALLAFAYSFLGSFLGVFGRVLGTDQVPAGSVQSLGEVYSGLFALLTLLSAMAAMDSSMIAAANLGGLELYARLFVGKPPLQAAAADRGQVLAGKVSILALATAAVSFLASDEPRAGALPAALLTEVMMMGMGPPCLLLAVWKESWKPSPLAFLLPVSAGLVIGVIHQATAGCREAYLDTCAAYAASPVVGWRIGTGPQADQLALTVFTLLFCVLACWAGFAFDQHLR